MSCIASGLTYVQLHVHCCSTQMEQTQFYVFILIWRWNHMVCDIPALFEESFNFSYSRINSGNWRIWISLNIFDLKGIAKIFYTNFWNKSNRDLTPPILDPQISPLPELILLYQETKVLRLWQKIKIRLIFTWKK